MEVIKNHPENVDAHWWLGTKLQAEHDYRKALEEFSACISLDSSYNLGYPYRDRANCKNNLRNDTGAVADMSSAIRLNPTERYFYLDRGAYLSNLNKKEAALEDFNKALEIWDQFAEARIEKAKVLVQMKYYKEAMTEYDKLYFSNGFAHDPNNAWDFYYRGVARYNLNDKEKACSDWAIAAVNCEDAKNEMKTKCK